MPSGKYRALICVATSMLACGGGSSGVKPPGWTVLVYVAADNTLEADSIINLQQMAQIGSTADLNIVVQIDRGLQYSTAPILNVPYSSPGAKRLLVKNGSFQVLQELGSTDSGSTLVLSDFVRWGSTTFPAQHMALILWDHGGNWAGGFGVDDTSNDHLTISNIKQALTSGLERTGRSKFDLLGFDACLMASVEVLDVLAPLANYYLASEETEPGLGWDYSRLQLLKDTPSTDAITLGKNLIDGFVAQNPQATATLALIDVSQFAAVRAQVTAAASQLQASLPGSALAIAEARAATLDFGHSPDPSANYNVVDFGDFMNKLAERSGAFSSAAAGASAALQAAVLYHKQGTAEKGASGLTIYLPATSDFYQQAAYDALAEMNDWHAFLEAFYGLGSTLAAPTFASGTVLAVSVDPGNHDILISGSLDSATSSSVATAQLRYGFSFPASAPGAGNDEIDFYGERDASLSGSTLAASWNRSLLQLAQGSLTAYGYLGITLRGTQGIATVPLAYMPAGASNCSAAGVQLASRVIVFDTATGKLVQDTLYGSENGATSVLHPAAGSHLSPVVYSLAGSKNLTQAPTSSGWGCLATQFAALPLPTISFITPAITSPTQHAFLLSAENALGKGDAQAAFGNY